MTITIRRELPSQLHLCTHTVITLFHTFLYNASILVPLVVARESCYEQSGAVISTFTAC